MTVVLDSNIFITCLTSKSPFHFIYQSLIKSQFELAVSNEIIFEYQEIISQKYNSVTANTFVSLLHELPNVRYANPYYKWQLITSDPDDNKYCDCAIATQADYLVTEDRHFSIVKSIPFPKLNILTIQEFAEFINSNTK